MNAIPFSTPGNSWNDIGQFVLFIVIALYAVGLVWLRRLAKIEVPERFLIGGSSRRSGDERMEVVGQ